MQTTVHKIEKKTSRTPMPKQSLAERIRNFDEVALGYTEEDALNEASRCIQCKNPMCVRGCPVDIDIPRFILQIKQKDFSGAIRTIKEKNSLPAICGRVCPQEDQCEKWCILGKKGEPVAIGRLERFVADWERASGTIHIPVISDRIDKKVAVVGAGPAGLTAAGELAKMGYRVTVFEALHKPGGVLVYGIPEFRLPKCIVEFESQFVQQLGVEFCYNYVVGRSGSLEDLFKEGYEAIFLGTGAGLPYFLNIPGENLNGVYSSNEFLTRINLMRAYRFPEYDTPIYVGKNVAVIGGGNVAMDAARCAVRMGAENVYLVYRRTRAELPAREEEIENALEEGVKPMYLTLPIEIIGNAQGWVSGLHCIRMKLGEPDASGRPKPVPIPDSNFTLDVDTVVIAIGQGPNPLLPLTTPDLQANGGGHIIADPMTGKTSKKGVFAGGDVVSGSATVILAMGAGKKAAYAIDHYLKTGIW